MSLKNYTVWKSTIHNTSIIEKVLNNKSQFVPIANCFGVSAIEKPKKFSETTANKIIEKLGGYKVKI